MKKTYTFLQGSVLSYVNLKVFESNGITSSMVFGDVVIDVDEKTFRISSASCGVVKEIASGNRDDLVTAWVNGREADFGQEKMEGYKILVADNVTSFEVIRRYAIQREDGVQSNGWPSITSPETVTIKKDGTFYDITCGDETRSFDIFGVLGFRINGADVMLPDRYYFRYF